MIYYPQRNYIGVSSHREGAFKVHLIPLTGPSSCNASLEGRTCNASSFATGVAGCRRKPFRAGSHVLQVAPASSRFHAGRGILLAPHSNAAASKKLGGLRGRPAALDGTVPRHHNVGSCWTEAKTIYSGGPFCGCPYNRSRTTLGCIFGRLTFRNSQILHITLTLACLVLAFRRCGGLVYKPSRVPSISTLNPGSVYAHTYTIYQQGAETPKAHLNKK